MPCLGKNEAGYSVVGTAGLALSLDEGRGSKANSPSHDNLDHPQKILHRSENRKDKEEKIQPS